MSEQNKRLRLLFVGNSHTFFNDMPEMVAERFREDGYDCEVAMIAHGGWSLGHLWKNRKYSLISVTDITIMWYCRICPIRLYRNEDS